MHIRRAVKVLRSFIALFHNPSRAADAAPGAHRSRKARYVRYVADATPAWRLICFIACFGLLLSSRPVLPASMGKSAEKTKARLTQGPPGLNLPNLNEARRMRASAPKIAPPVSATFASKVTPPAPAPLSLQEDNLLMALIDQRNRVGTSGEDLLSRNFNWGASIVSLPGRAGLGLNISLSLNSLIWTKSGTNMHFNLDRGFPSPGFRLGFPELGAAFNNTETGTASRLITMPSGWRYEFRENPSLGPNVYEEMGGTRMLLVIKPGTFNFRDTVWTLLLTDGTAYKFKIPTNGNNPKCIEVKDRNGNFISVAYTAFERISAVTDALGRVVNFNYDDSNRLISITQNWGG
ncbi:MAG TPA: RHS repeat domain-containing protein, partial [Blastocatellia bacterium]|nr:RHS repeat domain-containing protein [Blastocatellia bacterium]